MSNVGPQKNPSLTTREVNTLIPLEPHAPTDTVRFEWTRPHSDAPRWEQAFSPDGGRTWETNWVMNFTRQQ